MVLAGLFIGGVVAVWRVWRTPSAAYRHPLGGGRLLLVGVVCEILGLWWDDLWHHLFGLDLDAGLWGPPHLTVILGVWIQAAGCVTAALSDEPRARPGSAYLAAGALLASVAPIFGPIEYMPPSRISRAASSAGSRAAGSSDVRVRRCRLETPPLIVIVFP